METMEWETTEITQNQKQTKDQKNINKPYFNKKNRILDRNCSNVITISESSNINNMSKISKRIINSKIGHQ